MSTAQYNAGQARGNAQGKTEEWVQSAQNTANRASDNLADTKESAQQGKEQSAGFLQQTGEQVMHMAQGAIDGVKNTFGVGGPHGTQGAQEAQGAQAALGAQGAKAALGAQGAQVARGAQPTHDKK